MHTVTVHTTQNIDIDYEVAGLGERILAGLIDFGFFVAFAIVVAIILSIADSREVSIGLMIVLVLCYAFYDLVSEVFFNGQSFGKRIMKIKVISLNGARPRFSQYLLRWLFRIVDVSITYSACAMICIAVSSKKQRLGDIVAGTTLIKTAPRANIDSLVFVPAMEGYSPTYRNVTELTDSDIVLIHEVISNFNKSGNSVLIYNMAIRIKEHLGISVLERTNDYQFLQTIIKDYNYLTAAMDA